MNDTAIGAHGGVEMTDDEAFAIINTLQDDAQPNTIAKIADLIRRGRDAGQNDVQVATAICNYIFRGEPKHAAR